MLLEIITPERKVFSGEATAVKVPGTLGSFQVLNNHAPIISTLVPGEVKVRTVAGEDTFHIKGGVIEVLNNIVTILSEGASDND